MKSDAANLPRKPGVYFFIDEKGGIIYIGKATNLKNRVLSYFHASYSANRPIEMMMHKVADIKTQETDSVLEALILESNLIKKYQPKYNIDLKDDKSFSYFAITGEKFPRILILRATDIDLENLKTNNYKLKAIFGPYTSKKQILIALKIIRKIFPFHSNKQETEKGCLDYQIGLCPGPYEGSISRADYLKNIRGIGMILTGKKKSLIKKLQKEMKGFAKNHEFEKAAELRNKIFALQHINDVALINKDFVEKSSVIKHQPLRIEAYDISNISGTSAVGSMVVFTNEKPDKSQYRKFKIKTFSGSDDVGMMKEILLRRFKHSDPHLSRFHRDILSLEERGRQGKNFSWPMPDLILLDGGLGHLNMAEKLLHQELGFNACPVKFTEGGAKQFNGVKIVAVAKGPTRKKLEIRISRSEKTEEGIREILNDRNLIKQIMDEAHRFAITFHRKLRRRNALK